MMIFIGCTKTSATYFVNMRQHADEKPVQKKKKDVLLQM